MYGVCSAIFYRRMRICKIFWCFLFPRNFTQPEICSTYLMTDSFGQRRLNLCCLQACSKCSVITPQGKVHGSLSALLYQARVSSATRGCSLARGSTNVEPPHSLPARRILVGQHSSRPAIYPSTYLQQPSRIGRSKAASPRITCMVSVNSLLPKHYNSSA